MADLPTPFDEGCFTTNVSRSAAMRHFVEQAHAPNTTIAYAADWNAFVQWCLAAGYPTVDHDAPVAIASYLTGLAEQGYSVSTIARRLASLSKQFQLIQREDPTKDPRVRLVWKGIRRTLGVAQQGKAPILIDHLRLMLDTLPDNSLGTRDRAILLLGFAGAFRRSELVSLNTEGVTFVPEGVTIMLRRSKTDQEGKGVKIGIPFGLRDETCPVRALRDWLTHIEGCPGPLFRAVDRHGRVKFGRLSDKAIALVIKRSADAAGLDPSIYSGHSLRAGLATQAAINKVSDRAIMQQTRHRSRAMLDRYVRDSSLFRDNAAGAVGL